MLILVTGPEYSGTGLLTDIIRHLVKDEHEVIHRAMPHVDEHGCEIWWNHEHYHHDMCFVIRKHDSDAYIRSAEKRGKGDALNRLMLADKRLMEVAPVWYENLVADPEGFIRILASVIGVEYTPYPNKIFAQ